MIIDRGETFFYHKNEIYRKIQIASKAVRRDGRALYCLGRDLVRDGHGLIVGRNVSGVATKWSRIEVQVGWA